MSRCERTRTGGIVAALLLAATLGGCRLDQAVPLDPEDRLGGIVADRIVAIGDGYAAGATDGALGATGQRFSALALLAEAVGADGPRQPLVSEPGLALDGSNRGRLTLVHLRPLELDRLSAGAPLDLSPARPFENLGVPGALVSEALVAQNEATSPRGNRFYDLVLGGRGTFAQQAATLDSSLILLWIGTADVLGFVEAGGDAALAPGLPTPVGTFAATYEQLLDALLQVTDQVVLFTVPDPRDMPLVSTVPGVATDPANGEPIEITVIEPVIDPVTGQPVLDPVTGDTLRAQQQKTIPLLGPGGPLQPPDRVLLGALPALAEGVGVPASVGGSGDPLPDRLVLDAAELELVSAAVAGYNQAIRSLAADHDLPLVDVHALVERFADGGVTTDGVRLSAEFPTGQAYGLDGAHFTPKGYGVVVNRVIDALNARYGGSLPHLRTTGLPGVAVLQAP